MSSQPLQDLRLNGTVLARRLREHRPPSPSCPPHRWGCPVVMKVDPRSVAWTCGSCGAIATTASGDGPPER
jgi:hypothetical protein